jgi:glycosyltransferase involved in cell wall biosynthesis
VIEAQAASLPVIASDAGGFRETITAGSPTEGASGWLAAPGDVAAWHQALVTLVNTDGAVRQQMGENGRAKASTYFTEQALCARTLSVYQQVIAQQQTASRR